MILSAVSALFLGTVSALIIEVPTNPHPGAVTDIFWNNGPDDPATWHLALMNSSYIWGLFAILERNVDASKGNLTVTLPSDLPNL